ncbi:hypothetical protein BH23GEM4_BH23GEM4_17110 [soil metagenome]
MRPAIALLAMVVLTAGCVTKRNLNDLQAEIQIGQEEMLRELRAQHERMLDSLGRQEVQTRGDRANRILQLDRQLVQIHELTRQSQQRLNDLRQQVAERARAAAAADTTEGGAAAGDPQELFNTSLAALRRGSHAAARAGFGEFLRAFPQHPLASDAQFHLGESYQQSGDAERALQAYARVVQAYAGSARAPAALNAAASIEIERANRDAARTLLNQLLRAYPRSPEAESARQRLRSLGS